MSAVESRVDFTCDECGRDFSVSARYMRLVRRGTYPQPSHCRGCSPTALRGRPERARVSPKVTDTERRWALAHFTDEEISQIAHDCWGMPYHPEVVAAKREELSLAASAAA